MASASAMGNRTGWLIRGHYLIPSIVTNT